MTEADRIVLASLDSARRARRERQSVYVYEAPVRHLALGQCARASSCCSITGYFIATPAAVARPAKRARSS